MRCVEAKENEVFEEKAIEVQISNMQVLNAPPMKKQRIHSTLLAATSSLGTGHDTVGSLLSFRTLWVK